MYHNFSLYFNLKTNPLKIFSLFRNNSKDFRKRLNYFKLYDEVSILFRKKKHRWLMKVVYCLTSNVIKILFLNKIFNSLANTENRKKDFFL